jgi:Xaa-Pro aminopeptidase
MEQSVAAAPPGTGVSLPVEEFEARWSAAQQEARDRGLAGLVIWSRGGGGFDSFWDVFYMSGFYSAYPWYPDNPPLWSGRSFAAIVLPIDREPTLIVDIPDWRRDLVRIADTRFSVAVVETVADVLQERGLSDAKLGLVGTYVLPVGMYRTLEEATAGAAYVPSNDILENLQLIKSPRELDLVREAAEVCNKMIEAIMGAALQPGTTEAEAVAAGRAIGIREGAATFQSAVASGPNSHHFAYGTIPSWTQRVLEEGDLFHVDNYGFVNGYLYDYARGLVVGGNPSPDQRAVLEAGIDAVEAGVELIRPGVKASEVYHAVEKVLVERDMNGDGGETSSPAMCLAMGGHGHSIGCGWGGPYLFEGDDRELQEGMCIAVETMAGRPGIGSTIYEQDVIVHACGNEVISTAPKAYW